MQIIWFPLFVYTCRSSSGRESGWSARCDTRVRMNPHSTSSSLLSLCPCWWSSLSLSTATGKLSFIRLTSHAPKQKTKSRGALETIIIWTCWPWTVKCQIVNEQTFKYSMLLVPRLWLFFFYLLPLISCENGFLCYCSGSHGLSSCLCENNNNIC